MDMIGVMPEPAERNRCFSAGWKLVLKSPYGPSAWSRSPTATASWRWFDTGPPATRLTVMVNVFVPNGAEEIDEALRRIGTDRPPILLAHSTGGLTAALWAQRHPGTVRALALNSPWLEMHLGPAARLLLEGPVKALAERLQGKPILPQGSPFYARTTHRDYGGLYDYDLDLKPPRGHPFPAQTLGAVLEGQKRLAAAGPLRIPILVMHSSRTRIGVLFTEEMRRSDTVLDVRAIRQAALRLGPDVWVEAIDGARHDVFMSDADARVRAIATLDAWLEQVSGPALTMKPIGGAPREGGAEAASEEEGQR